MLFYIYIYIYCYHFQPSEGGFTFSSIMQRSSSCWIVFLFSLYAVYLSFSFFFFLFSLYASTEIE